MKRNLLAIVVLLGLVVWGSYDWMKEKTDSRIGNSQIQQTQEDISNLPIGIQKGNVAPDFELKNLAGESIKLSDLRGKKVIVNMWATWCPPCRAEMPDMQRIFEKYKDDGVAILGVNLTKSEQRPENVAAFLEEFGITFPVVLDTESEVAALYQIQPIPTSYLIDSRGVIQEKVIGSMDYAMMKDILSEME